MSGLMMISSPLKTRRLWGEFTIARHLFTVALIHDGVVRSLCSWSRGQNPKLFNHILN
jgi:hypothetical protein